MEKVVKKPAVRKRLIKTAVEAAKYTGDASKNEHCIIWDTRVAGFGLRIYPSGKKSFFVSYRYAGRKRRMVIGRSGRTTAQQARAKAKKVLGKVDDGIDPLAEREEARRGATLREVWHRYLTEYATPARMKPRTIRDEHGYWERYIGHRFGGRRLDDISKQEVLRLQHRLSEDRGVYAANDAVTFLRRLYNRAAEWGYITPEANPTLGIRLYREKARERFLDLDELARIGAVLKEWQERETEAVAYVRLLLFTGARAGEILRLRWDEVDFKSHQLRLQDSKTGPKEIELAPPTMEVLESLKQGRQPGTLFVFPGRDPHKPRYDYFRRFWKLLCAEANLQDLRQHDLRHTYASMGVAGNLSLKMIGELLGHQQTSTTERYSHLDRDPKRQAADTIAAALEAALEDTVETGDVVPFGQR